MHDCQRFDTAESITQSVMEVATTSNNIHTANDATSSINSNSNHSFCHMINSSKNQQKHESCWRERSEKYSPGQATALVDLSAVGSFRN